MSINISIKILDHAKNLPLPFYATNGSAGMDLYAAIDRDLKIAPMEVKIIPTGICVAIPDDHEIQIRPRSGLAAKNSITVLNTPGTIDADYRGEIQVIMINLGKEEFTVNQAMRIAQMILSPISKINFVEVEELPSTERGTGGLGSTGYK